MNTSMIQSQLAYNRHMLRILLAAKKHSKTQRIANKIMGDEVAEQFHSKDYDYYTRTIAKLEKLQKTLKADMQRELAFQRANRAMQAIRESGMGVAGEVYE